MRGWRNERSASFDNPRRAVPTQYRSRGDLSNNSSTHEESDQRHSSPAQQGRRVQGQPRRSNQGGVDDGLSMMTSSLLTMLDTPEEAAAEGYEYDYYDEEIEDERGHYQLPPHGGGRANSGPGTQDMSRSSHHDPNYQGQAYRMHGHPSDQDMYSGVMHSPVMESQYQDPQAIDSEDSSNWLGVRWKGMLSRCL